MKLYNFTRLIKKYSSSFVLISKSSGEYNDMGDWVSGEDVQMELSGAIISFSENRLYRETGALTANDKHLYMLTEITGALEDKYVIFKDRKYKIEEEKENAEFTGVFSYVLKYVSAFDRKEGDSVD